MASFLDKLFGDPDTKTKDLFLVSSPLPVAAILAVYLLFTTKWGPYYMQNRKPYSLKGALMVYNLLQVAANLFLITETTKMWWGYNWNCQPRDTSTSPLALWHAKLCYIYFLNKLSDLIDTVFFVLRKKNNQISFLHLFHHTEMPIATWLIVRYIPIGHVTSVGLFNTFVHVFLYLYYFLAAFGPAVQKYLWWKKYITRLQLIQFCVIFLHNMQLLYFDCDFPKWTIFLTLPNAVFFYYLFFDFYKKAYKVVNSDGRSVKKDK